MCSVRVGLPHVWIWGLAWLFFLFLAGRAVAQIELDWTDWLNATWIMGGGNSRRAHPDKKFTTRSPPHANFPPLPSVFLNHFSFFFFFNGHTDQPRDTNRTVVTLSVFTQSGLLARMKRSHWHIGWMDGRLWHVMADRHLQRENKPMDMSTSTKITNRQAWTSWWSYLKHTLTDEGTIASKVQLLFVTTYSPNLTWARCLSRRFIISFPIVFYGYRLSLLLKLTFLYAIRK